MHSRETTIFGFNMGTEKLEMWFRFSLHILWERLLLRGSEFR